MPTEDYSIVQKVLDPKYKPRLEVGQRKTTFNYMEESWEQGLIMEGFPEEVTLGLILKG